MYNTEFTISCKRIGNANERPHDSLNAVQESKRETPKYILHSVLLCVCLIVRLGKLLKTGREG